ncbi:GGDEF domain-containing protein [Thiomicrorhabdus sediminis]|uniref:diguanylate cyclase n=1 Tax=Thiomicrorhabdus sediminis TaxID=2580412 RepID=A0A4P9K512_9GAMM|nr:GGDEF domain-containing protein [Thiomicrorhabdus sediminis]QCU90052.1 GGDEF domain-containing protein [Thiomicrorhabdus sediminis]
MTISSLYTNIMTSGLALDTNDPNYRRIRIINFILYLSVIINALLIKPNLDDGQTIYPISSAIVVIVGSIAIWLLRRGIQHFKLVAHTSLFVIYIILFPALFEGGIANSGFVWYFLLPLFSVFLLGMKPGMFWIGLMFLTETAGLIFLDPQSLPYRKEFLFYHMLSLAVGTIFISYMQSITEQYEKAWQAQNEILHKMSITDPLTQLHNRRHIDEQLALHIEKAKRYQRHLSLVLLDVDNFKMINDTFGHHTGDQVLIKVAQTLKNTLRKVDFIGRWGGEEFIIICDSCNPEEAANLVEKVRTALENTDFGIGMPVTASFGITSMCNQPSIHAIINRVDKALYQAKAQGKNTIIIN